MPYAPSASPTTAASNVMPGDVVKVEVVSSNETAAIEAPGDL